MVNTCQQIGGAVGAAALSAVFTNAVTDYLGNHPQAAVASQAAAASHGYSAAFTVAAWILLAGAIITPLLLRSGRIAASEGASVAL
jgi:membrane protease YdiL (CAAX protease family)